MTTTEAIHGQAESVAGPARRRRWPSPARWFDLGAAVLFVAGALWITCRGWLHVYSGLLGTQPIDQIFNEWMLAHDAHAVAHLENPFFTTLQNAPDGVNLMGNVAMQLPGLILTPVTLLGGAQLSYLLLITFNLAATGYAWYHVLSRHVVSSRLAALVGGVFCGFAPGMVAHSNGHPHITAQFLVPFLIWRVARLREPGRAVRNGLVLGGLIAAQFFIGEEILLLTAVGCGLAALGYLVFRPRQAWREAPTVLAGLGVAGALVLALVAYPLWLQFFGPQHYQGAPNNYPADLGMYPAFGQESLAGSVEEAKGLAVNATEEAGFFGWPALTLALVSAVWLWRSLVARLAVLTTVVAVALSLGPNIVYKGRSTGVPGPYALLDGLPVFDAMIISRFALLAGVALGVLFAVAADRVLTLRPAARVVGCAVIAAALVPMAPTPLEHAERPAVPHFITSGEWRAYVAPEHTLVPVPVVGRTGLRWAIVAQVGFAVPQGYFLGPKSPDDDSGRWNAPSRPTARLLWRVYTGEKVTLSAADRERAREDMRFWKADAAVLDDRASHATALRQTLDELYGPGTHVDDVWVWRIRAS